MAVKTVRFNEWIDVHASYFLNDDRTFWTRKAGPKTLL